MRKSELTLYIVGGLMIASLAFAAVLGPGEFDKLLVTGTSELQGALDMNTNQISGVVDPTLDQDAATKKYHDDNDSVGLANIVEDTTPQLGGSLDANGFAIDMNNQQINNQADPSLDQDGATKKYHDDNTGPTQVYEQVYKDDVAITKRFGINFYDSVLTGDDPAKLVSDVHLDGDKKTPGNDQYYGTNAAGTKGWHARALIGTGPGSSTDNAVVRWDGSLGSNIQNSGVTIDDLNQVIIPGISTTLGDGTEGRIDFDHAASVAAYIEAAVGLTDYAGDGGYRLLGGGGETTEYLRCGTATSVLECQVSQPWIFNSAFNALEGGLYGNGIEVQRDAGSSIIVSRKNGSGGEDFLKIDATAGDMSWGPVDNTYDAGIGRVVADEMGTLAGDDFNVRGDTLKVGNVTAADQFFQFIVDKIVNALGWDEANDWVEVDEDFNVTGSITQSGVAVVTTPVVNADIDYSVTVGSDPAYNTKECVFAVEGASAGGFICEGITDDAFEHLYLFPQVGLLADQTRYITTNPVEIALFTGDKLSVTSQTLNVTETNDLDAAVAGTLPLANLTDDDVTANKCMVSGGAGGDPNFATCPGGGSTVNAMLGHSGAGSVVAKGATAYVGVSSGVVSATEANQEFYVTQAGTIQNLYTYVSANATGAAGNTVTLRKNGASQSTVTTYGSGVTGLLSDTSNTFTVAAGDQISIQVVNTGSGGGTKDLVVETVTFELAP